MDLVRRAVGRFKEGGSGRPRDPGDAIESLAGRTNTDAYELMTFDRPKSAILATPESSKGSPCKHSPNFWAIH